MEQQSALQKQYPLSSRKFWKKIINQVAPYYFIGLVIMTILFSVSMVITNADFQPWDIAGIIVLAIVPALIFLGIYSLYINAYIKRYYYDAGDNFVTIKKGVFAPAEIHVQYQKIQDVYVDQDIVDRMLGLYDVHIASATVSSGIEAHIDGIDKASADALKTMLLNKIQGKTFSGETTPSSAVTSQNNTASAPIKASFAEEISSKTFPISGSWLMVRFIGSIFASIFWSLIIMSYVALPGKNHTISLTQSLGFDQYNFIFWFALFAIFLLGHCIFFVLWKKNFSFEFTPEYIFVHTGIIGKQEKHVPYNTLQDVGVSQTVIERLFGIASVKIENASAGQTVPVGRNGKTMFLGIMIPGQTPANAQKITEALKNVILSKSSGRNNTGL